MDLPDPGLSERLCEAVHEPNGFSASDCTFHYAMLLSVFPVPAAEYLCHLLFSVSLEADGLFDGFFPARSGDQRDPDPDPVGALQWQCFMVGNADHGIMHCRVRRHYDEKNGPCLCTVKSSICLQSC